jgi:calcium binding protein 39
MTCKVSNNTGMLGRLFRSDATTGSWPARVQELCRDLADSLKTSSSSTEQVRQSLQAATNAFDEPATTAIEKQDLLSGLLQSDLPAKMLEALPNLDFEARKDVMRLFSVILQLGGAPVFEYVRTQGQILQLLLEGCGSPEVALHSHMMLRNCCVHVELVKIMLEHGFATREEIGLLRLARHSTFDISSDAFSSLRELLLTHKVEAAQYLETHFREFFTLYNELLQVQDYVTKRQALRLLGEILLDRKFMRVMLAYVGDEQFLQIHMNLLRETGSKAIQADAFHIFKIFAANPNKPPRVHQILLKNRDRLIKLLDSLGKEADESFAQDRKAVVQALRALEALPTAVAAKDGSPTAGSTSAPPPTLPDKATVTEQADENAA